MKIVSILFLAVVIGTSSVCGLSAMETIELAIGDWEPYTSETDEKGKLLEIVVTAAFKLEGIEVRYTYYPWKRSYVSAKEGYVAGTFPWAKTEEHEKDFYLHKLPLIIDEGVYFHLKGSQFDWNTIEDLKKYTVGVTLGYKEVILYKEKGIEADAVPSEYLNFKKMLSGRIDVYQTSKTVGYAIINRLFTAAEAKQFTHHAKPAVINEFFILFSKKKPNGRALADTFDSGLKKLRESGEYTRITTEYAFKTSQGANSL